MPPSSRRSRRPRAGQRELHQAARDLVLELAELVQAQELVLDVGGAHQEHPPRPARVDDLATGCSFVVAHRVQQVEEAPLGQVVRGELLVIVPRSRPKSTAIFSRPAATRFGGVLVHACSVMPPRLPISGQVRVERPRAEPANAPPS
jgi:hypothetical protein